MFISLFQEWSLYSDYESYIYSHFFNLYLVSLFSIIRSAQTLIIQGRIKVFVGPRHFEDTRQQLSLLINLATLFEFS